MVLAKLVTIRITPMVTQRLLSKADRDFLITENCVSFVFRCKFCIPRRPCRCGTGCPASLGQSVCCLTHLALSVSLVLPGFQLSRSSWGDLLAAGEICWHLNAVNWGTVRMLWAPAERGHRATFGTAGVRVGGGLHL